MILAVVNAIYAIRRSKTARIILHSNKAYNIQYAHLYEVISDIHTRVIHWIMGLTELIPTHFTPDG